MMKKPRLWALRIGLSLVVFVGVLLLAELSIQFVVEHVWLQGKVFEANSVLGWRNIPGLKKIRKNTAGALWHIEINSAGYRSPSTWKPGAAKRILILGDSFAFGEGIDLEQRFDSLLAAKHSDWSFVNLGVMGYGTDQEFIAGRPYFNELRAGDTVVLLTHINDLYEIQRHSLYGRSKPWFEWKAGTLREHPPRLGWKERLRDRSVLVAKAISAFDQRASYYSPETITSGMPLYRALVEKSAGDLSRRGITVYLLYHGFAPLDTTPETLQLVHRSFRELNDQAPVVCVNLDAALNTASLTPFLQDRHWNAHGNEVVAAALEQLLQSYESSKTP